MPEHAATAYFHASVDRFAPGEVLLPGQKPHPGPHYPQWKSGSVYLATTEDEAREWGHLVAAAHRARTVHLYAVRPLTKPVHHVDPTTDLTEARVRRAEVLSLLDSWETPA